MTHEETCWCEYAIELCATMHQSLEMIERLLATHNHDIKPVTEIRWRDLAINTNANDVSMAGTKINLTLLEWKILRVLALNRNQWLTYGQITESVWGVDYDGFGDAPMIKTHVSHLRTKLKPLAIIETSLGCGYRCYLPDEEATHV